MADENVFMLYAFLMGIFVTFVYDLLRISRRVIPHNTFWVSVEDLIFWGYCAVSVFLLMYHMSNGTLRWFAVLGALAGMTIYHKTISRFLVNKSARALNAVKNFICRILGNIRKRFTAFLKKRLTSFLKVLKMIVCKK